MILFNILLFPSYGLIGVIVSVAITAVVRLIIQMSAFGRLIRGMRST